MDLTRERVLIVEDEILTGIDLAGEIEDAGGLAIGPSASIRDALSVIETGDVTAAILDVTVRDGETTRVATHLIGRGIPFIVYTGGGLPPRLRTSFGDAPVHIKPTNSRRLISALATEIACARTRGVVSGPIVRKDVLAHALVIEDEPQTALILNACLHHFGYRSVAQADTEAAAVEAARSRRPDLLLVDIRLKEGDGLAAARAIRIAYGVPMVVVTARPDLASQIDARFVVAKPFTTDALRMAVERAQLTVAS